MRDIVKIKKSHHEYVAVDTQLTMDAGWETMVFPCDETGYILNWGEYDVDRYPDEESAVKGHKEMIKKWEES